MDFLNLKNLLRYILQFLYVLGADNEMPLVLNLFAVFLQ